MDKIDRFCIGLFGVLLSIPLLFFIAVEIVTILFAKVPIIYILIGMWVIGFVVLFIAIKNPKDMIKIIR